MALELRLDASNIEGLSDGDAVSTWTDQSGNGRDVTQGSGAAQPKYKTGILNGLPVVRFDGGDFLRATGFTLEQPNTIFVVVRVENKGGNEYVFSGGETKHGLFYDPGATDIWRLFAGSGVEDGATDGEWHYVAVVFNGAGSLVRQDGEQTGEGNAGGNSLGGITLGATDSGTLNLTGDIAEVRVYGTALSTAEIEAVESELAEQWGFSGGVTIAAPPADADASAPAPVLGFEELTIAAPPADADASAPAPVLEIVISTLAANADASSPAAEVATGPMLSPTDHKRGLPLPHPSILANPARLGPPRFTALERKTLGLD